MKKRTLTPRCIALAGASLLVCGATLPAGTAKAQSVTPQSPTAGLQLGRQAPIPMKPPLSLLPPQKISSGAAVVANPTRSSTRSSRRSSVTA